MLQADEEMVLCSCLFSDVFSDSVGFGCGLRHDICLLLILTVVKGLLGLMKADESKGPAPEPGL